MGSKRAKRRKRARSETSEVAMPKAAKVERQTTNENMGKSSKLPGTNMLRIASFLLIVAGAASGVIMYYAMKNIDTMPEQTLRQITSAYGQSPADYMLSLIFACAIGVVQILAGYQGIKEANKPEKVRLLLSMGFTLLVLEFCYQLFCLNTSSTMNWATLISGLTLSIFYIWGALRIKKRLKTL